MASRSNGKKDPLQRYREKRDFSITSEPPPKATKSRGELQFVIQKHWATRLHYDFRLELDGVLLSWAVPKGPSFDPKEKRIAVQTEDHPLGYASFEGTIPPKQYGAGTVIVWDRGTWQPEGDPREGYAKGKLLFRLHGEKLAGLWELVRINPKEGEKQIPWILFKKKDRWARPLADYDVVTALPDSVNQKPLGPVEQREHRAEEPRDALGAAVKSPLPLKLSPQLATLTKAAPTVGDWVYEIKFDGYRILARIDGGKARLITRAGNDWTDKMKSLAQEVEALGVRSAWLDGEVVVLGPNGVPVFNALQNAFDSSRTDTITYFIFDAPYFEGYDLRSVPLQARRALLKQLLDEKGTDRVRFSEAFEASAASVLQSACALNLEGVIAKRKDAPYVGERSDTWLKLKCASRQEFVIGGYSDRTNAPDEVGSLMLGVHDDQGRLLSVGSVGTGWDHETGRELKRKLARLRTDTSPFDPSAPPKPGRWSRRVAGSEHWVKPQLVAEVSFAEWTPDGHIRHASFAGLRADKPAKAIRREEATDIAPAPRNAAASVKVSHPERVIDPSTGIQKLELVRYYESVAEFILPHLRGRPTSLVRAPAGITGELFFQKHPEKLKIPGITMLDRALWPGHDALLQIDNAQALVGAAQMNVVEFHTWNALSKNIDKPDRFILDLDPGEGVTWPHLQEAALLTRALLQELGLESWLKTSGGKGLHVVVPIAPRHGWDTVKAFSQAVVQHMAKVIPQRFVAKAGGANRVGKIFIDYLRNGHGQTTASAFSARSRPGMGVSMPVSWDQLATLKSGSQWSVLTAREYLSFQGDDPWAGFWQARQGLREAMKRLGFEP